MFRVLFLCTGNSAGSQIAEALLNHHGAGRFQAESAGTEPAARVNPGAVEALAAAGIEWHGQAPQSVDGLEHRPWDLPAAARYQHHLRAAMLHVVRGPGRGAVR